MDTYKEKYNEALERAKEQLETAKVFDYKEEQIAHDIRETVYAISPLLKESEDEKTRKEIVGYLKRNLRLEWAAWLEKQGEQKHNCGKDDEKVIKRIDSLLYAINESEFEDIHAWLKCLKDKLQSQSQWKPSDEQLNNLKQAINAFPYETDYLELLYDDLKKLKGE